MSTAAQTKIFGIRLGVDPKVLVLGLIVLAGIIYWYNSRNDTDTVRTGGGRAAEAAPAIAPTVASRRGPGQRRRANHADRGTLRLPSVVPANGDVDPILRTDLLDRLGKVTLPSGTRNLFEIGPAEQSGPGAGAVPNRIIPVKAIPLPQPVVAPIAPAEMQANIPLKYYGFARPTGTGEANRGFFLSGDDIVVAAEGQLVQQRYLVVQLTAMTAKLEDTQVKLGQMLAVVPEALEQGGGNFGRQPTQPGMNPGFQNQGEVSEP